MSNQFAVSRLGPCGRGAHGRACVAADRETPPAGLGESPAAGGGYTDATPMLMVQIGAFEVVARAFKPGSGHAQWRVMHQCGEELVSDGGTLRKAQAGRWELRCPRCWRPPAG